MKKKVIHVTRTIWNVQTKTVRTLQGRNIAGLELGDVVQETHFQSHQGSTVPRDNLIALEEESDEQDIISQDLVPRQESTRNLCPVCPVGAIVKLFGKSNAKYCCPPRKTVTKVGELMHAVKVL